MAIDPSELCSLVRPKHVNYPAMPIYLRSSLGERNRQPVPGAAPAPVLNRLQEYEAMADGPAKRVFLKNNAAEINRLRVEAKKSE